jgi:hypothetical protein
MKKNSTVATSRKQIFKEKKLTIGMDLGDQFTYYCVVDEAGEVILEQKLPTTKHRDETSVWQNAAQPSGSGDRSPFSLGQPAVDPTGT